MAKLLLVEDDERISGPLARMLRAEGFEVETVDQGHAAIDCTRAGAPDLVLLDLSLPDVDGLDVCRELRRTLPALPIVMLTARGEEVDVVVGLGAGADDYVVKPFRVAELVARIRSRLRVVPPWPPPTTSSAGATHDDGLHIDTGGRRVWVDGDELSLTPKEYDLLAYLSARPGVTLRREQIMADVWDEHWFGSTRTLDTHVAALRRKLHDHDDPPRFITTVRGVGLRFDAE